MARSFNMYFTLIVFISFLILRINGSQCPTQALQNGGFESGRFSPWTTYTDSDSKVSISSRGDQSHYSSLLSGHSNNKNGAYASLTQSFTPCKGNVYGVSFSYYQYPGTSGKGISITFGVLDQTVEEYLVAETIDLNPNGKPDSLGNPPGQWFTVMSGNFTANGDLEEFSIVLEMGVDTSAQILVDNINVTKM